MKETLSTAELAYQSKCPEYTITYWRNQGVIAPFGDRNPGSGYHLEWNPEVVTVLKVLVKIEKSFAVVSTQLLKKVVENFEKGQLELEEGIILKWS